MYDATASRGALAGLNSQGLSQARNHATATSKIETHVPVKFDTRTCDRLKERIEKTREVTNFLSSLFHGLEEERAGLIDFCGPDLVALCETHGVSLNFVDLRWGITPTMSEGRWTVKTCLEAVGESDTFIGLYGQRYGASMVDGKSRDWLLPSLENCYEEFSWLERHPSVPGGKRYYYDCQVYHALGI